jgi:hypothetical protein
MGNTGREMVQGGAWVKVNRKHYRHISGIEIAYDGNRWLWKVSDGTAYTLLWAARHWAEKLALEAMPAGAEVH